MFLIFQFFYLLSHILNNNILSVNVFNQTLKANISESVELQCPILINITINDSVNWYFDNKTNNTSFLEQNSNGRIRSGVNGSLIINKLDYGDSKIYTCQRLERTFGIKLIVLGPPQNFTNFTYVPLSDSEIKLLWNIRYTEESKLKYTITLCKVSKKDECQNVLSNYSQSSVTLKNLTAFSDYNASIIASNGFGVNKISVITNMRTKPGRPIATPSITKKDIGNTNVTIRIECPECLTEKMRGHLDHYVVTYKDVNDEKVSLKWNTTNSTIEHIISGLHPYTEYKLIVSASNGVLSGPSISTSCTTKQRNPDPVMIFMTDKITNDSITVKWHSVNDEFGPITGYLLQLSDNQSYAIFKGPSTYYYVHTIENLKPRHIYYLGLAANNSAGLSNFTNITVQTAPISPKLDHVKIIQGFVRVAWKNIFSANETAKFKYEVCWVSDRERQADKTCISSDNDQSIKCNCKFNISMHSIDILNSRINLNHSHLYFWITVSPEACGFKCDFKVSSPMKPLDYNGYKPPYDPSVSPDWSKAATTVLIIGCVIFIGGFVVFFYFCGNKNLKSLFFSRPSNRHYTGHTPQYIEIPQSKISQPQILPLEQTPYPPIHIDDFVEHITNYRCDDGAGFQTEFEAIELMDTSMWTITYPLLKDNKIKNRYTNIFPYDHSRVTLHNPNGKSDYINASFIDGYNRRHAYIATQGPLPDTIGDFWQMVYEQNSEIIVMISNFDERGRRKCEVYWVPNKVVTYGNICVRQIYHKKMAFYTERRFSIKNIRNKKNAGKERIVYHYQYTDWRDFDVPPSSLPVLVFVKATTKHWSDNSGPIIVHCSAGVGRTGTYVCIESQIRQMDVEKNINVRGFLEHIRQQRMKLVQTESQYTFIHDALYEYFLCADHQIHKDIFNNFIFQLKSMDSDGASKLEEQFKMCTQSEPTTYEYVQSKKPYNVTKNRSNILPIESRRINLPCEPGIEGSNYINASAIQGYWDMKEFIITQHPLEETEQDFWKMVWDENCAVIILLSTENLPQFWPAYENDFRKYRGSQVTYCNSEENGSIAQYGFLLSSQREDYALNCTLHHLKKWPEDALSSTDLLSLLFKVNTEKDHSPVVVIDDDGGSNAGIFVALSTLFNQLRNDDAVDVYFVMKMIHTERPHIFSDSGDLKFVYELLQFVISNQSSYSFFTNQQPDLIPNGVCHSGPSPKTNPTNHQSSFIGPYATLTSTLRSARSSTSTARRRASSAESGPLSLLYSQSPVKPRRPNNNRISWQPVETRYSVILDPVCTPPRPTSIQITQNPITDLPVARVIPRAPSGADLVNTDV